MSRDRNSEKIFVTGGNGFIGSHLLPLLIADGFSVRCLLRKSSNTERIDHLKFERIIGDIRDQACLSAGIKGCDGVIHLAAISNWADIASPRIPEVIVEGSRKLLDAAREQGNLKTVYVSSASAIGGTKVPRIQNENAHLNLKGKKYSYAVAKAEVEKVCRNYATDGLPIIIVNPTEVYGPDDTGLITSEILVEFAKGKRVFVTKGGTSIIHVDDVAKGILAAYDHGKSGERYILGGDNLSFYELSTLTLEILGQNKPVITLPAIFIRFIILLSQWLRLPLGINPAALEYALLYWYMDNSKARQELGLDFRSAKETLVPTLQWLKDKHLIE